MATSTMGSLLLSIETNVAQFTSDMGRMAQIAESNMARMNRAAANLKRGMQDLATGLAVTALAGLADNLLKTVAHLQDLHMQTGLSVEALSAMTVVGKQTGVGIDELSAAFDHLQKSAYTAQSGTGAAAQMFRNLGLGSKELAAGLKDPDRLLLEVAQGLSRFADDGNKSVYMTTLLGRSGAETAAFLRQLADQGYAAADATAEEAKRANDLIATYERLKAQLAATSTSVLVDMLPTINKMAAGLELLGSNFKTSWAETMIDFQYDFKIAVEAVAGSIDYLVKYFKYAWNTMRMVPDQEPIASESFDHMGDLLRERSAQLQGIENMRALAAQQYVASTQQVSAGPVSGARPSLPGATVFTTDTSAMRRAIDEQLKALNEGAKKIEAAWQTHDDILDREYKNGEMSLAEYGDTKVALMQSSFDAVQAVYDAEIDAITKYAAQLEVERARALKAGDKTAISKIAAQIDEANSKLQTAQIDKAGALNTALKAQEQYTSEATAASNTYADALIEVDKRYYEVIGDTEQLTRLDIERQDAQLRGVLVAQQAWTALEKLNLVEQELIAHSKKDALSGLVTGLNDWAKAASNVAEKTRGLVTNFLDGMTDALVTFVQTGKLNFRSLINSMIADLARLIIEQEMAGWVASAASYFGGGFGGGTGRTAEMTLGGGDFTGFAEGGSFTVGGSGGLDTTPVAFMATAGERVSVTPRGGTGDGAQLVYAPVINIDSRSDRAQVQADTANVVRQGNKEMLQMLMRYNPGLRA